jgi:hypothetical protein
VTAEMVAMLITRAVTTAETVVIEAVGVVAAL